MTMNNDNANKIATIEIKCGDSIQEMKKMKDASIDLIITSPPYADQRKSTKTHQIFLFSKRTKLAYKE